MDEQSGCSPDVEQVPNGFLLGDPKFTFELNSLATRQDLLTLAAQQLTFEHEQANTMRQRQRPPKIEDFWIKKLSITFQLVL